MHHYGNLDTLTVTAIKNASYHENGAVVNVANLTAGRIVVEQGGYIKEVELASTATKTTAAVVVNGYVGVVDSSAIASAEDKVEATGSGYVAHNGSSEATAMGNSELVITSIGTLADLHLFRDKVNSGAWDSNLTAKLTSDIDLTGVVWSPIGNNNHPFSGTFDGQNHTIKGLTNAGYLVDADSVFTTTTTATTGAQYGFFGLADSGDTTIRNIIFEDVAIDLAEGQSVGACLGRGGDNGTYNLTIDNIKVIGNSYVKANKDVGGITGKLYQKGTVVIQKCENNANIEGYLDAAESRAAGISSFISGSSNITINNCTNNGDVSFDRTGTLVCGIAIVKCGNNSVNVTISKNTNTGVLKGRCDYTYSQPNSGGMLDKYENRIGYVVGLFNDLGTITAKNNSNSGSYNDTASKQTSCYLVSNVEGKTAWISPTDPNYASNAYYPRTELNVND